MEQQQKTPRDRALDLITLVVPGWRPNTFQVLWTIRIAIIVVVVLFALLLTLSIIGSLFGIRLWNLLSVLAVPLTIGGAVPLLNWLQKRRELEREDQSAQDAALQAYLGAMSDLIIDHHLRTSQSDEDTWAAARQPGEAVEQSREDVRTLARARTSTVVPILDSERKRRVVQFLYESDLINKDNRIVSLQGVILSKVSLRGLDLSRADLSKTSLDEADLRYANLKEADLSNAFLTNADLRGATLQGAYLMGANMTGAKGPANLSGAHVSEHTAQDLRTGHSTYIPSATMPDGRKAEDWLQDQEGRGEDTETIRPS